jgi:hypothetical protein
MVNETAAWGTVTIYAPTKDALEDFIYLKILSEKDATYTTEFSNFPPYATPTEDEFSYEKMIQTLYGKHDVYVEEDGSFSVNLALCGIGRWTFGQNARWFFSYPFEELEYETSRQNKLRDDLKKLSFRAKFEIEEEEIDISYSHDLYEVAWNNGETDFKEKNIKYERILPHHDEFSIGQYD